MRRVLLAFFTLCLLCPLFGGYAEIAKTERLDLWYETFGQKEKPALLLIMGSGCQGLFWFEEFCEKLAQEGFYVIRYDHRDIGLSTRFDFEKTPYTLLDMAKDAMALLDYLKIEKAHVCGLSMGGPIAELMAAYFPERIASVSLIATSSDFRPAISGFENVSQTTSKLSAPTDTYLEWVHTYVRKEDLTPEEKLKSRLLSCKILCGCAVPFDEETYRHIYQQCSTRISEPDRPNNHLFAIKNSMEMILQAPSQVHVPTLIVHGTEDPAFLPDHGDSLAAAIPHAKYVLVKGMGHLLDVHFYDLLATHISEIAHR